MNLAQLLQGLDIRAIHGEIPARRVAGLTYSSRQAAPGMFFAALAGTHLDGHVFVGEAAARGALAALVDHWLDEPICQIEVADTRRALALMAARFHGDPSHRMTVVGVTGTNGKTSLTYLAESLLALKGTTGMVGTVVTRYPGVCRPSAMTTPESLDLQALLAGMRAQGVEGVAMEVSSHALVQNRVDGVMFDLGVFTNLTRDHLDYHGDMEHYLAAKARLFTGVLPEAKKGGKSPGAVICVDDPRGAELAVMARDAGLEVLTYGLEDGADVQGVDLKGGLFGGSCRVLWPGGVFRLETSLVGRFNLQNITGAAAVGLALGLTPGEIFQAVKALSVVPGRLERIPGPLRGPAVFVDYAHTDQALAGMLAALRPLAKERLICVFGAGGDRDQGKRPLMGLAVGKAADLAWLTSDNPRSEDPLAIISMVERGLQEAGARQVEDPMVAGPAYIVEPERNVAIARAVALARREDVVVIAGKGHEDYQIVGPEKRHFDDREQASWAMALREEEMAVPEKGDA